MVNTAQCTNNQPVLTGPLQARFNIQYFYLGTGINGLRNVCPNYGVVVLGMLRWVGTSLILLTGMDWDGPRRL